MVYSVNKNVTFTAGSASAYGISLSLGSIFQIDGTNSVDDYSNYSNIFKKYEVYAVKV